MTTESTQGIPGMPGLGRNRRSLERWRRGSELARLRQTGAPGRGQRRTDFRADQAPEFIIHAGDLSHTSQAAEFETPDQVLKSAKTTEVFYVPGEHDTSVEEASSIWNATQRYAGQRLEWRAWGNWGRINSHG
jgi:3',5'-cyclic AMP phosphodiesterase CpdA